MPIRQGGILPSRASTWPRDHFRVAADAKGLRVEVFEARTADQVPVAIEAANQAGAAGLITLEDPLIVRIRRQIAELAAKSRLPKQLRHSVSQSRIRFLLTPIR